MVSGPLTAEELAERLQLPTDLVAEYFFGLLQAAGAIATAPAHSVDRLPPEHLDRFPPWFKEMLLKETEGYGPT